MGLVLGILGLNKVKRGLATNRGVALAGTIISALAILGCIGWGIFGFMAAMSNYAG